LLNIRHKVCSSRYLKSTWGGIKHLMTGPKGNSEFCLPETLNVPQGKAEGNVEVEGKQNSQFPTGPVIKKDNCEEIVCLTLAGSQICRSFKKHELIMCESKVQVVVSLGS